MEDFQAIRAKQQQWMREHKTEIENPLQMTPGDLVNALTDKLTKNQSKIQKNTKKALASQMETNTCSICFELMLPKLHSPILLFPCGHTFCKQCVEHDQKAKNRTCPGCQEKIVSQAINLSLQNIIVAYAKENNLKVVQDERPVETDECQLEMYGLRCKILYEEKIISLGLVEKLQERVGFEEIGQEMLRAEEEKIVRRILDAEKELKLVREYRRISQGRIDKIVREVETREKSIELIDETLIPTEREMNKLLILKKINKN